MSHASQPAAAAPAGPSPEPGAAQPVAPSVTGPSPQPGAVVPAPRSGRRW